MSVTRCLWNLLILLVMFFAVVVLPRCGDGPDVSAHQHASSSSRTNPKSFVSPLGHQGDLQPAWLSCGAERPDVPSGLARLVGPGRNTVRFEPVSCRGSDADRVPGMR